MFDAYVMSTRAGVYTPNGSAVTVISNQFLAFDWTAKEVADFNRQVCNSYPGVVNIGLATKKYNCHSYAWYSQSISNYYWINNPKIYMSDGSYKSDLLIISGRKVYWTNGSHSAIVSSPSPNLKYKSKWGQLGVYEHTKSNCPYTGSVSYYKR